MAVFCHLRILHHMTCQASNLDQLNTILKILIWCYDILINVVRWEVAACLGVAYSQLHIYYLSPTVGWWDVEACLDACLGVPSSFLLFMQAFSLNRKASFFSSLFLHMTMLFKLGFINLSKYLSHVSWCSTSCIYFESSMKKTCHFVLQNLIHC